MGLTRLSRAVSTTPLPNIGECTEAIASRGQREAGIVDIGSVEQVAKERYEPQWVTPEEYREKLIHIISTTPSSQVVWGFGSGKNLQNTANSIQNEIYTEYSSCMMWVDLKRFNWETKQEIFDLMSCEKEAILIQVEGDAKDKDFVNFIEAIVDAPPFIHYNGKKKKAVPVTIIGYSTIPKGDIRIAEAVVQESVSASWTQDFLMRYVSVLVVS